MKDDKFVRALEDKAFLLTESGNSSKLLTFSCSFVGKLVTPTKVFFYESSLSAVFESDVDFLHSHVKDREVLIWLEREVRVQRISTENIVKKIILPMIEKQRVKKDNIVEITLQLFASWKQKEWSKSTLSSHDWATLSRLGALARNGKVLNFAECLLAFPYSAIIEYVIFFFITFFFGFGFGFGFFFLPINSSTIPFLVLLIV
jgi:hypothetical protein